MPELFFMTKREVQTLVTTLRTTLKRDFPMGETGKVRIQRGVDYYAGAHQ